MKSLLSIYYLGVWLSILHISYISSIQNDFLQVYSDLIAQLKVRTRDDEFTKALFTALQERRYDRLKDMVRYAALLGIKNIQNSYADTPLHKVIDTRDLPLIQTIYELWPDDIDKKNLDWLSPRDKAQQDPAFYQELLEVITPSSHRVLVDPSLVTIYDLIAIVRDYKYPYIRKLLKYVSDINTLDEYGQTLLHYAVRLGNLELIISLLRAGSDPDRVNIEGISSLQEAYNQCFTENQEDTHNDADADDTDSVTHYGPVYYARCDIIYAIELYKTNKNTLNRLLERILLKQTLDPADIRYLKMIAQEISINTRDVHSFTPLHRAVLADNTELVKLLLSLGASAFIPNKYKQTAFDCAVMQAGKNGSSLQVLLQAAQLDNRVIS